MGNEKSKGKKDPYAQLYDASFEMRMQAKSLEKEAQRARAKEQQERAKAKKFMDKGDMESAKMVAGEAIRFRNEGLNYSRMSAKMGAVSAKLDSAYRTQQVSAQIKQAVPSLKNALKQMEKSGISTNMADFEKVFEDLDVQVEGVTGALDNVVGASSADSDAVSELLG